MFQIDFKRLIALLLPMSLRQPLIFGLLRAGVSGVESVYGNFTAARKEHNFRLTHNGQVCYLRGMLNYYFGPGFRIVTREQEGEWLYAITEAGQEIPRAVTESGSDEPVPVLYSERHLNAAENDFDVLYPAQYADRLEEIKAMVDKYKLPTKRANYYAITGPVAPGGGRPWTQWDPNTLLNRLTTNPNEYRAIFND